MILFRQGLKLNLELAIQLGYADWPASISKPPVSFAKGSGATDVQVAMLDFF